MVDLLRLDSEETRQRIYNMQKIQTNKEGKVFEFKPGGGKKYGNTNLALQWRVLMYAPQGSLMWPFPLQKNFN